ncbi:hypothetical protein FGG08_006386 [Glutinoglossum americanum]|uniref:Uncharacterized protein n=1 Tax=Glutinoglossum americanum TaxID=1670608 RepID=A0A9P8I115_9PEZI|nr:hypothetical protein FGG08_006386 [Glutinoglossum americanum]
MTVELPHASLSRTHTAPTAVHTRALNGTAAIPLAQRSHSGYTGGSHGSTGMSHLSTNSSQQLNGNPSPVSGNNRVVASDNIVNQLADSSKSLYQICLSLQQRLSEVPGFDVHLKENSYDDGHAGDDTDPVNSMWRCLRRGYPLMTIYNALNPAQRLEIDESKVTPANRPKKASFLFVNACLKDLHFPPDECFVITDLFGDDTTGFVKVTKVVGRVLDMLKERNLLQTTTIYDSDTETITDKNHKRTYRDHVVAELVDTERKYVQDLEVLQQFKKLVQETGAVAGDVIFTIFMNLNALLDFQRRFLIRVETTNSLPEEAQQWGQLFVTYEESFRVYEPYIANQHKCTATAEQEFENLRSVGHPITVDWTTFSGFLLKPVQRLTKYPLLLKDLRDKCNASPEQQKDLDAGFQASQQVLERANDAVDKVVRNEAVEDLAVRVEDWKGHRIDQFGELLLYGTFTVVKGDGRSSDMEREVGIDFKFENDHKAPRRLDEIQEAIEITSGLQRSGLNVNSTISKDLPKRKPEPLMLRRSAEEGSEGDFKPPRSFKSLFLRSPRSAGLRTPPTPSANSASELLGRLRDLDASQVSSNESEEGVGVCALTPNTPSRKSRARHKHGLLEAYNFHYEMNGFFSDQTVCLETESKSTLYNPVTKKSLLEEKYADEMHIKFWDTIQYKIYLFERILLCCKESSQNKQKNRVIGGNKSTADKKGKSKLQLKGRIFMQNVTDTLCLQKPGKGYFDEEAVSASLRLRYSLGSYTVQIWWKGDPGVENFIIRYQSEETMKKWYNMVTQQNKVFQDAEKRALESRSSGSKTSDTEFAWVKNQSGQIENPYQQADDDDDDDDETLYGSHDQTIYTPQSEFSMSRNASSTSLRSRSATGESGPPMTQANYPQGVNRVPPPRFPMLNNVQPPQPLTLYTQVQGNAAPSPGDRMVGGNSYFSPIAESPASSRASSSSSMYPFPRQATPNGSFHEDHARFTAPAMGRTVSRDGQSVSPVYQVNSRSIQRPSLPAIAPQLPQPPMMPQNRLRSASSPDIHNSSGQARRGLPNSHPPVPPFPSHIAYGGPGVNRSQNNSPTAPPNVLPIRAATQSPGVQRERLGQQLNHYPGAYAPEPQILPRSVPPPLRTIGPISTQAADSREISPALASSSSLVGDPSNAAVQLKVKVTFLDNYVTLVVSSNIKYQSLANRIDHKLARSTNLSIGGGTLRLRYKDEDGDFVTIHSDDDIQMAITDWREQQNGNTVSLGMAEIQLYCQTIEN